MVYFCRLCNRDFKHPGNLKRHQDGNKCSGKGTHNGRFICPKCPTLFARHDIMKRHLLNVHTNNLFYACGVCPMYFANLAEMKRHRIDDHTYSTDFALTKSAHRKQTQFHRMYYPDSVVTSDEGLTHSRSHITNLLTNNLMEQPRFRVNLTLGLEMYKLDEEGVCTAMEMFSFRSTGFIANKYMNMDESIDTAYEEIERNIAEFLYQGSGWKILRPFYMDAELVEINALNGSSVGAHVAVYARNKGIVPDENSTILLDDGSCFYAAIGAAILGETTPWEDLQAWYGRVADKFGLNVEINDIGKIEKYFREEMKLDISINVVYCDERQRIVPVRAGVSPLDSRQIVLLLSYTGNETARERMCPTISERREDHEASESDATTYLTEAEMTRHYSLVLDPDLLFAKRAKSKGTDKISTRRHCVCWNCLNIYYDTDTFKNHVSFCRKNACQQVIMPKEGDTMKFRNKERKVDLPDGIDDDTLAGWRSRSFRSAYVLYFDFEALHVEPERVCSCSPEVIERTKQQQDREARFAKASEAERAEWAVQEQMMDGEAAREMEGEIFRLRAEGSRKRCFNFPPMEKSKKLCTHKTKVCADQKAFSYSYYLMNRDGQVLENKAVDSEDAAECFVQDVLDIADTYLPSLSPGATMRQMSDWEKNVALASDKCYLCGEEFDESIPNLTRVLDHDHLNGNYLGVAHNICNLHRREEFTLTCFSHNFSGYDSHFLVKVLGRMNDEATKIRGIPLNTQKFKCLTINDRIRFLDSAAFLNAPLADCAETLVKSDHPFPLLSELCDDEGQKKLLLRKGVYPYSFATSVQKLRDAKELPPKSAFYNELTDRDISDDDYEHAKQVWEAFEIKNMMEYTTLYLRTDTVLLAEAMTVLGDNMWEDFKLDVTKYLSLPMLAKDIMLKTTDAELELISDQEMSDLIQKNLRGGLSFINKRLAEKKGADEVVTEGDERSLLYTDCTNLYGKAMCMPLPLRDFEWMTEEEIEAFDPMIDVHDKNGTGYFLEVDLEYPKELHKKHNSYPMAAESMQLNEDDLSPYAYNCMRATSGGKKKKYSAKKLTSSFHPRTRYLCHGLNLQLYLKQGMRLVRIHRGIKFYQHDFIRPYIEMCSERRKTAKTEAMRNMYKLLCNSLYGKLIEGFEKRMDCFFNRSRADALRNATHPLFKAAVVCDEDLSLSFMRKPMVRMNQCWAVGFSVLELSKYWMQKLYYEEIQPAFADVGGCTVLMSDTDSLLLETACKTADEAMDQIRHLMDTSNYEKSHRLYSERFAKVPGYMKNEIPRDEIKLFVGLKSKTYALRTVNNEVQMKAKGVPERQKHKIPVDEMINCLKAMKTYSVKYHALRSVDHINQLVKSDRVAFSSFDDKRYLLCEIHSVPYGSQLINESIDMGGCYFCRHPSMLI